MAVWQHLRRASLAAGVLTIFALPVATGTARTTRIAGEKVAVPCIASVLSCDNPAPPHRPACAHADAVPRLGTIGRAENATLCLVNRQRALHGRSKLRSNATLRRVAGAYAVRMATRNFFSHVSPAGTTFDQRIRDAGYLHGFSAWTMGENIAWGAGHLSTPRQIVRAWMHSPEHRRNILDRHYRDAGLGIAVGLPVHGSGATYVNEFARRTR